MKTHIGRPRSNKISVTTTVDRDQYDLLRERGISITHALAEGCDVVLGVLSTETADRIAKLERANGILQARLLEALREQEEK